MAAPRLHASIRSVSLSTGRLARPGLHTLRTRRHRLLWDETTDTYQLFDVQQDPGETRDIADSEPRLGSNLRNVLLDRLAALSSEGGLDAESSPIPDELLKRLRALGYVQ